MTFLLGRKKKRCGSVTTRFSIRHRFEVAEKIGLYPAHAIAAVLSTIDTPPPGQVHRTRSNFNYDPYASPLQAMASGTEIVTYVLADVPIVFDHQYTDTVCTQSLCHRCRPPVDVADTF